MALLDLTPEELLVKREEEKRKLKESLCLLSLENVFYSSVRWWENRRPISWSEEEHLRNPTVNMIGDVEKELAKVVVAEIQRRKGN